MEMELSYGPTDEQSDNTHDDPTSRPMPISRNGTLPAEVLAMYKAMERDERRDGVLPLDLMKPHEFGLLRCTEDD